MAVCQQEGQPGRGIQYPIVPPKEGEWHSPWHAYMVEPSKQAIRLALRYHLRHPDSPLRYITTDMIDMPDYGGGARYSLFEQNVAIAEWFRRTAAEIREQEQADVAVAL